MRNAWIICRKELIEQFRIAEFRKIPALVEGPTFCADAPDASVLVIAARVAEIHFAVLNDRI